MSYNKIIEELIEENEELKQKNDRLQKAHSNGWKAKDKVINQLKNDLIRAEAMEDYWKINSSQLEEDLEELKEENKSLIESKNIWFDSHRLVTQERDKLKQELKEYRGF